MKKSKKLIASFLATLMLMAVIAPAASAASVRMTILRDAQNTRRGTEAGAVSGRRVGANIYMERANGTSIHHTATSAAGHSARTNLLLTANMVIANHTVWFL